jgi:hypothetical protein
MTKSLILSGFRWTVLASTAAVLAFGAGRFLWQNYIIRTAHAQSATAFTVQSEVIHRTTASERVAQRYSEFIASDGSRLRLSEHAEATRLGGFYSLERPNGLIAVWYPGLKAKWSGIRNSAMLAADLGRRLNPAQGCAAAFNERNSTPAIRIGTEAILGVPTVRMQMTAGDQVTESWLAPDLQCYALRRETRFANGEVTIERVTSLSRDPIADSQFEIPQGLEEVRPSELNRRVAAALGRECPECMRLARKDAFYDSLNRP